MQSMIVKRGVVEWQPQSDWIDISNVANNEIHLLVGDFITYIAFAVTVTGGYTVNWGDGVTENFTSAATATHTYTAGTGQTCSLGYTTFKIRIYAQTPSNNITQFGVKSNDTKFVSNSILWAKFGTSRISALNAVMYYTGSGVAPVTSPYVECVEFPDSMPDIAYCQYMFRECVNLQKVVLPTSSGSSTRNCLEMFYGCKSLRQINSLNILTNATVMQSCFYQCASLTSITLPSTMNSVTDWQSAFSNCNSLLSMTLPAINTDARCDAMFSGCWSIKSIIFPSSWNNRITSLNSTFQTCSSLKTITLPDSVNLSANSYLGSAFASCLNLQSVNIPTINGTTQTNIANMFVNCNNLKTVSNFPAFNSATTITTMFQNCFSLSSISNLDQLGNTTSNYDLAIVFAGMRSITTLSIRMKITGRFMLAGVDGTQQIALNSLRLTNATSTFAGSSPQVDIQYASLAATALNTLFGDLPTVTGKTIRITGNPGAGTCDTSIATTKGWTVTT